MKVVATTTFVLFGVETLGRKNALFISAIGTGNALLYCWSDSQDSSPAWDSFKYCNAESFRSVEGYGGNVVHLCLFLVDGMGWIDLRFWGFLAERFASFWSIDGRFVCRTRSQCWGRCRRESITRKNRVVSYCMYIDRAVHFVCFNSLLLDVQFFLLVPTLNRFRSIIIINLLLAFWQTHIVGFRVEFDHHLDTKWSKTRTMNQGRNKPSYPGLEDQVHQSQMQKGGSAQATQSHTTKAWLNIWSKSCALNWRLILLECRGSLPLCISCEWQTLLRLVFGPRLVLKQRTKWILCPSRSWVYLNEHLNW